MSFVEWFGFVLDAPWPPETWMLLLSIRMLNLVITTALIIELKDHPRFAHLRNDLALIWVFFFIRVYITPEHRYPADLATMWWGLFYVLIGTRVWLELKKMGCSTSGNEIKT